MNDEERLKSLKQITLVIYALQAFSFLTGLTLLIGVIINYVKRDDVQGTWLASHFRWQIRTFWFSLLWMVLGGITAPIGIGVVILLAATVWLIYRIIRGWLALMDGREMYDESLRGG